MTMQITNMVMPSVQSSDSNVQTESSIEEQVLFSQYMDSECTEGESLETGEELEEKQEVELVPVMSLLNFNQPINVKEIGVELSNSLEGETKVNEELGDSSLLPKNELEVEELARPFIGKTPPIIQNEFTAPIQKLMTVNQEQSTISLDGVEKLSDGVGTFSDELETFPNGLDTFSNGFKVFREQGTNSMLKAHEALTNEDLSMITKEPLINNEELTTSVIEPLVSNEGRLIVNKKRVDSFVDKMRGVASEVIANAEQTINEQPLMNISVNRTIVDKTQELTTNLAVKNEELLSDLSGLSENLTSEVLEKVSLDTANELVAFEEIVPNNQALTGLKISNQGLIENHEVLNGTEVVWENKTEVEELMIKQASMMKNGDSTTMVVKLKPYNLGEMKISLEMENGQLKALIQVEKMDSQKIVEESLKMLHDEMKNSIIEVEHMQNSSKDGKNYEQQSSGERYSQGSEQKERQRNNGEENFQQMLEEMQESILNIKL